MAAHIPAHSIIFLKEASLRRDGAKVDNFTWSLPHLCHIYKGRTYPADRSGDMEADYELALQESGRQRTVRVRTVACSYPHLEKARAAKKKAGEVAQNDGLGTPGPALKGAARRAIGPDAHAHP